MHARISSLIVRASEIRSSSRRSPGPAWARFRNIAPAIVSAGARIVEKQGKPTLCECRTEDLEDDNSIHCHSKCCSLVCTLKGPLWMASLAIMDQSRTNASALTSRSQFSQFIDIIRSEAGSAMTMVEMWLFRGRRWSLGGNSRDGSQSLKNRRGASLLLIFAVLRSCDRLRTLLHLLHYSCSVGVWLTPNLVASILPFFPFQN